MQQNLAPLWKLVGGFDLMDVDNGFYMVMFDLEDDRDKVINGGPWMIFDHYLVVSTWSPNFVSSTGKIEKTLVWIKFSGMNLVYYDESLLIAMAFSIGRPIEVDERTLRVDRGRFARICVEIDLNQPVVGKVLVRGMCYKMEYEGLHVLCGGCGCYGHVSRNCPPKKTTMEQVPEVVVVVSHSGENSAMSKSPQPSLIPDISAHSMQWDKFEKPINIDESIDSEPMIDELLHGDRLTVSRMTKTTKGIPRNKENNLGAKSKEFSNKFAALSKNTFTPNRSIKLSTKGAQRDHVNLGPKESNTNKASSSYKT